jgi:2-keto-3-deoxy-6-phosphogluconate aldolase
MQVPVKGVRTIDRNSADVIVRMQRQRLVAVVRSNSADEAYTTARPASDGGIGFVEITLTVPGAFASSKS